MKQLTSLFFTSFFLLLQSVYAYSADCLSFQKSLNIQNEVMEYVSCSINNEKQGVPIELRYRFKGSDALEVERYLIEIFNINPIERKRAHAFWSSYKSYEPQRNLQIFIGTEEYLYVQTRDDWGKIDYFYYFFLNIQG